jgi:hypothetical protein
VSPPTQTSFNAWIMGGIMGGVVDGMMGGIFRSVGVRSCARRPDASLEPPTRDSPVGDGWEGGRNALLGHRHPTGPVRLMSYGSLAVHERWGDRWNVRRNARWRKTGKRVRRVFTFMLFSFLPPQPGAQVWVYDRTGSLLVAMLMHASLTASVRIFDPLAIAGVPLLTYNLVLAAALWVAVAAIHVANRGQLERAG